MSYPADPGGRFASDAHRRVMAHLPNPDDDPVPFDVLVTERVNRDPHTLAHFGNALELREVLTDLKEGGHAKELKGGWKNTPGGFDLLIGPPDETAITEGPATIGLDPAALSSNGGE